MAYRRRRSPTKGKRCTRWKRVRVRGAGMQRRCAKFGGKRSGYPKSRRSSSRSRRRTSPGMAKRGSHCVRRTFVWSPAAHKHVKRCVKFSR